jgi:phenylacetate-CoA ligase
VIFGSPHYVLDLRDRLRATGGILRPRLIVTTGDRLVPGARDSISSFFAAPVMDDYGMNEFEEIATQCPRGSYHIECERLFVEIIDADSNVVPEGTVGEIVVTNLINKAMPLIRYRTGDIGSLASDPCPCGRPHKCLTVVDGRATGYISLPEGGKAEANPLSWIAETLPVERFQAVQYTPTEISFLVMPMPSWTEGDALDLKSRAEALLEGQIQVTVETVDDSSFVRKRNHKMQDYVNMMRDDVDA